MSKIKCIGIIAEDDSDFEASKALIKRISKKNNLSFKKAIGNGCGKVRRKAYDYAVNLKNRGCDMLILIHDLDRHDFNTLKADLKTRLKKSPFTTQLICIPIEEIEAWFLSDPSGLKEIFKLKKNPNIKGLPETIPSPKEKLEEIIYICSDKNTTYLNTTHNQIISEKISIDLMKTKCNSFKTFHDFVKEQKY